MPHTSEIPSHQRPDRPVSVRPVDRIHSTGGSAPIGPLFSLRRHGSDCTAALPASIQGEKRRAHGPTLVRGPPSCYICQRRSRGGRGGDADGQPDGIAGNGGEPPKLADQPGGPVLPGPGGRAGGRCRPRGAGGLGDGPEPMGLKRLVAHGPFREDRRPRGRGRIDLARAHPGARHPPSGSRPTIGRGSGSGRAPGDDGLARPCDRAPAGLHHAGVASPRRGPREVPGPRRRARGLWRERDARPHLRDPDNHRRRTRHGRRDEPAASVTGTGAALLAIRPAGRPGRRLVYGTTGRRVDAHPAIHPGRSGLRH